MRLALLNRPARLRLPEFIGIGPERTGTTWLHEALSGVADLPDIKETHFFSHRYGRGIAWYAYHFRNYDGSRPIGEICPYFGYGEAIGRVYAHLPNCKLICTFRDPVDRAFSCYRLMRSLSQTRAGFEEALATRREISEASRYAFYLGRWQERFGKDRVMVTLYDDLLADPQGYLDRVCDFIDAKPIALSERRFGPMAPNRVDRAPRNYYLAKGASRLVSVLHAAHAPRVFNLLLRWGVWAYCFGGGEWFAPLKPEVDARVREHFRPEVEALEENIQRDLSSWKMARADRVLKLKNSANETATAHSFRELS